MGQGEVCVGCQPASQLGWASGCMLAAGPTGRQGWGFNVLGTVSWCAGFGCGLRCVGSMSRVLPPAIDGRVRWLTELGGAFSETSWLERRGHCKHCSKYSRFRWRQGLSPSVPLLHHKLHLCLLHETSHRQHASLGWRASRTRSGTAAGTLTRLPAVLLLLQHNLDATEGCHSCMVYQHRLRRPPAARSTGSRQASGRSAVGSRTPAH